MNKSFKIGAAAVMALLIRLGSPAAEMSLAEKARGYSSRSMLELAIDSSDGIDAREAARMAEFQILAFIDLPTGASGIVAYGPPMSDGRNWRVDVSQNDPVPGEARRGPLFISKISGRIFGEGWFNIAGFDIDLGPATYCIDEWRGEIVASVRLKRRVAPGDETARTEILRESARALRLINEKLGAWFEPAVDSDIRVSEGWISHVPPGDEKDQMLAGSFRLVLKPSVSDLR